MTRDILVEIDAGTSIIKAVAFSLGGEQIGVAARPNVYQTLGAGQVSKTCFGPGLIALRHYES